MGHFDRARLITSQLRRPCTLIGTLPHPAEGVGDAVTLPDDSDGNASEPAGVDSTPQSFHFAPIDFAPVRERMALIAAWVARANPALMIVDVSVEVALFCRLMSLPTIYVRLAGDRSDMAHLEAFRAAASIIAPFPPQLEDPAMPAWVRDKTFYAGFIHAPPTNNAAVGIPNSVAVVAGSGGTQMTISDFVAAAAATPDFSWHVYGDIHSVDRLPSNLTLHGFVKDIDAAVARSGILIGAAGDGVLSLAVRHNKRFICIPQVRPYEEQTGKARVLHDLGAAIVREHWPEAHEWPALLNAARLIDQRHIRALKTDRSLSDVVAMIERVVDIVRSMSGPDCLPCLRRQKVL